MANITIYKVESYNSNYYKIFSGIYNDFRQNAANDYNFELNALEYDNFIKSVEKGLIHCLILFEDEIPTGFLVYTTLISEALELNIIHCIGNENLNQKRKLLIEKFLEINYDLVKQKIVTYPMLGKQAAFMQDLYSYGFKSVNTSVMAFNLTDASAINKLKEICVPDVEPEYKITNWQTYYFKDAVEVIHQAFKDSSDALFDPRFKSNRGAKDILSKITEDIYGQFLPGVTKVLLYKKHPVGFCLVNLTNAEIANIPIVAILKKHRHKGFGKILVKKAVDSLLDSAISGGWGLKELNVTCDSDYTSAVNMYMYCGFSEKYSYPQAYHPIA